MSSSRNLLLFAVLFLALTSVTLAKKKKKSDDEGKSWCGKENCFEVLGLKREEATPSVVKKKFYKLSMKLHPDRNPSPEAEEQFKRIGLAYEVIGKPTPRAEYEEFLDHPERFYEEGDGLYYRKHYFGEQENVWVVLFVIILMATFAERMYLMSRYRKTRDMLCNDNVVQDRVRLLRAARGQDNKTDARKSKKGGKRKRREEDMEITDEELFEVVQLEGFGPMPTWQSLLIIRMVFWPWAIAKFVYFRLRWTVLFDILKKEFGMPEKVYLTRTRLGISESRWNDLPVDSRKEFMRRQLWDDAIFENVKKSSTKGRRVGSAPKEEYYE